MSRTILHDIQPLEDHAPVLFYYSLYGLRLASALQCPELRTDDPGASDVVVRLGTVEWDVNSMPSTNVARHMGRDCVVLNIPGVARYQIERGSQIVIDADPNAVSAAIRLVLQGIAMIVILLQRAATLLHGSAVATPGGAVIFTAPSGSGKSTLAAALAKRGYPLLADDVCVVEVDEAGVRVHPAYPRINLLPDSLDALGIASVADDAPEAQMIPFSSKYRIPIGHFGQESAQVKTIYRLYPTGCDRVQLQTIYGFARVRELMNNIYGLRLERDDREEERHLINLQEIARQVDVVRVERPKEGYRLDELVDAIETDFSRS